MPRTRWSSVTRRAAVFLALASVGSLGCLLAPQEDGPSPGPNGGKSDDTLGVPEAYFTLDGPTLRSAGWPADFRKYSVFVCSPSFTVEDVSKIHQDIPGAIALAYTNIADIPLGAFPDSPYWQDLEAVFDTTFCVMDLVAHHVIRMADESGTGYPHWVPRQESADVLVAFHHDVTMAAGWDGFYIDQCEAHYPPWRLQKLAEATTAYDANGDGSPDTPEQVVAQYDTWRPYLVQRLREVMGNDAVLIANSGGPLGDANLNGICLEGVGTRFTPQEARSALLGQRDVSRMPFVAALWITTDGSRQPSLELAREIPGVHYGTVAYFP